ncbi:ABC transporter substrate-binding protein [Butyrivibrio sp. LC3010]|uniref:ABC transporter substrate-binding protein n=1 Tax=Butyrivibrio sp. LC3010 TaxID=1280680 RepID=UPI0004246883|nr:extracellular solute-binding protein [Butyrivibrio sp. LC3010]
MKRALTKKVTAAITLAAMTMSAVGCGAASNGTDANTATETETAASTEETAAEETTDAAEETADAEEADAEETEEADAEEASEGGDLYEVKTDADGNPIDLGGMEIIIRDWWSGDPTEPANDYEEALQEYRDWAQETYNFTIKQQAISDWGSTPADFVDYATTGGDENYLWVLRADPAITSAMANGLMYDLSTLDCLDFSKEKFQRNLLHEQFSKDGKIYAMYAGFSEPRTGVYFNKRILTDAGIDPETIYDMQADGSWTWDKFEELLSKVQRDTDNDGVIDIYGMTLNEGVMTTQAIFSNGGDLVGKDASGKYTYDLENPETLEALNWTVDMFTKYDAEVANPEGAEWDYYKEQFLNGQAAFLVEDEYAGCPGNFLEDMNDEVGFVMFPKGPSGKDYINVWSNNPVAIPACYDEEKAWKLAFAWDLWTNQPEGYEDYNGNISTARNGIFDSRSVDETITMMTQPEHGTVAYHGMIPNMDVGADFIWNITPGCVVSEQVEAIADTWKSYVDEANK